MRKPLARRDRTHERLCEVVLCALESIKNCHDDSTIAILALRCFVSIRTLTLTARRTMSTLNGAPLASTSKLFDGLSPSLPSVQGADSSLIALDAFRIAAAVHVRDTLGVELEQAFAGIEDGKKGQDLQLAVARFRLPGKNAAQEAAKKLAETVRWTLLTRSRG